MMMKWGPVTNTYNNNVQFFYSFDDSNGFRKRNMLSPSKGLDNHCL